MLRDGVVLVFPGLPAGDEQSALQPDPDGLSVRGGAVMLAAQALIHRPHAGLRGGPCCTGRHDGLQAIPVMLVLFILFPASPARYGVCPAMPYKGRTGLSDEMMPGTVSELVRSDTVAFRARFASATPPPNQRYWRGPVLWRFDGRRWTRHEELPANTPTFVAEGAAVDYGHPGTGAIGALFALDLPPACRRAAPA